MLWAWNQAKFCKDSRWIYLFFYLFQKWLWGVGAVLSIRVDRDECLTAATARGHLQRGEATRAWSDNVNFKPTSNYLSSPRPTVFVWLFRRAFVNMTSPDSTCVFSGRGTDCLCASVFQLVSRPPCGGSLDGLQWGGAANINTSPPPWEGSTRRGGLTFRSIATHLNVAQHFLARCCLSIDHQTLSAAGQQSASVANVTLFAHTATLAHNRVCVCVCF